MLVLISVKVSSITSSITDSGMSLIFKHDAFLGCFYVQGLHILMTLSLVSSCRFFFGLLQFGILA